MVGGSVPGGTGPHGAVTEAGGPLLPYGDRGRTVLDL